MNNRGMSITYGLILSNIIVFLLVGLAPSVPAYWNIPYAGADQSESLLYLRASYSWYTCIIEGQIWRLLSYQFMHAGLMHLVFNMWVLYFFGPAAEQAMGPRRFLLFYFACGIAGALFSSLLGMLGLFHTVSNSLQLSAALEDLTGVAGLTYWQVVPMVGASAAINGVLVAVAFLYPRAQVSLIFPPITMTMRLFAIVVLAFAVCTILLNGNNAGGEAGHLGGIIMSAIIMTIWRWRYLKQRWHDGSF